MKPPTCDLCGTPHWRNKPHIWPRKVVSEVAKSVDSGAQQAAAAAMRGESTVRIPSGARLAKLPKSAPQPKSTKPNGADPRDATIRDLRAQIAALTAENAQLKADAAELERRRNKNRDRMRNSRGGLKRKTA